MTTVTSATGSKVHQVEVIQAPGPAVGAMGLLLIGTGCYSVVRTADGFTFETDDARTGATVSHSVELWGPDCRCTCKDYQYRGRKALSRPCKHAACARLLEGASA